MLQIIHIRRFFIWFSRFSHLGETNPLWNMFQSGFVWSLVILIESDHCLIEWRARGRGGGKSLSKVGIHNYLQFLCDRPTELQIDKRDAPYPPPQKKRGVASLLHWWALISQSVAIFKWFNAIETKGKCITAGRRLLEVPNLSEMAASSIQLRLESCGHRCR